MHTLHTSRGTKRGKHPPIELKRTISNSVELLRTVNRTPSNYVELPKRTISNYVELEELEEVRGSLREFECGTIRNWRGTRGFTQIYTDFPDVPRVKRGRIMFHDSNWLELR